MRLLDISNNPARDRFILEWIKQVNDAGGPGEYEIPGIQIQTANACTQ